MTFFVDCKTQSYDLSLIQTNGFLCLQERYTNLIGVSCERKKQREREIWVKRMPKFTRICLGTYITYTYWLER